MDIKADVISMRLEDDETLVDRNGTPLCKRKNQIKALKDRGIETVEAFTKVEDWSVFFPLPEERWKRDMFKEIQEIKKSRDEWCARHSIGIHQSNPYCVATC